MQRKTLAAIAVGIGLAAASLGAPRNAAAALCATSDVSLMIGAISYAPSSCGDGVSQGRGSIAELRSLETRLGAVPESYSYLDKSDDSGTPLGLGGITFQVSAPSNTDNGIWSVTWTDVAGAPNLPAVVNLIVGLFGGNNGSGYLIENVLLPITPNTGTGTFDINFVNRGGNEPDLSHLLLGGRFVSSPPITNVPEPASMALLGAGLLGLGFTLRRGKAAA